MTTHTPLWYLNNSATSYPKPPEVGHAVFQALTDPPGMTGRGEEAGTRDRVLTARTALAAFLGVSHPERLILTSNSTDAMNLAIHGLFDARPGVRLHAVTTTNDHNSVLRPLRTLERQGRAALTIVPMRADGDFDADRILEALRPDTALLAINHLSNVVGTIAPLAHLGAACRERGIVFLVDASQSAGLLEIHAERMRIDLLAITGHKYLFGPTGIGALYIAPHVEIAPRRQGGTGVLSAWPYQPDEYPIRHEAGTVNYVGLMGLDAGRAWIEGIGLAQVRERSVALRRRCEESLRAIPGVEVFGPAADAEKGCVISFRIAGLDVAEADVILRTRYQLILRPGLHCAPLCHERLGTAPDGTLRASFSYLTPHEAGERLIAAVSELAVR